MPPKFDNEKCTGCGRCAEICPTDILRMRDGMPVVSYPNECWLCGACMMDCAANAIRLELPLWARPITQKAPPRTEK